MDHGVKPVINEEVYRIIGQMIRIGILGDIGSGKSYVAKNFGYPVFNADSEVSKLYKTNRKIFNKLKNNYQNLLLHFLLKKRNC